jgi:hypothetical protein
MPDMEILFPLMMSSVFFELYYNKNINITFIKNPYPFYQNHTLCEIDETLYKPIYDLKNGMTNYLDGLNGILQG